jgi:hypothetical protein
MLNLLASGTIALLQNAPSKPKPVPATCIWVIQRHWKKFPQWMGLDLLRFVAGQERKEPSWRYHFNSIWLVQHQQIPIPCDHIPSTRRQGTFEEFIVTRVTTDLRRKADRFHTASFPGYPSQCRGWICLQLFFPLYFPSDPLVLNENTLGEVKNEAPACQGS